MNPKIETTIITSDLARSMTDEEAIEFILDIDSTKGDCAFSEMLLRRLVANLKRDFTITEWEEILFELEQEVKDQ